MTDRLASSGAESQPELTPNRGGLDQVGELADRVLEPGLQRA